MASPDRSACPASVPSAPTVPSAPDVEAVLRRNDAYLQGFVEAYNLCPFARTCRETGRLHRAVLAGDGEALAAAIEAGMASLQDSSPDAVEVALLIAPAWSGDALAFEALVRRAHAAWTARLATQGDRPAFYAVAFHPHAGYSGDDAHRLVGLWRRSPDPTVQLVRASLLESLRGATVPDKLYVDPEDPAALAALVRHRTVKSLSERIAEANHATWRQHGEAVAELAAELAAERERKP